MNRYKKWLTGLVAASTLFLAACGSGSGDKTSSNDGTKQTANVELATQAENKETGKTGGTLHVALVSDSPFEGFFAKEFYTAAPDADLMRFSNESLFATDDNFQITDSGGATLDLDKAANTATIKIKDNVKWSDGEDVTADDMIFTYQVLASPDYTGQRYDSQMENIKGLKDFHDGKANSISGLEKVDDKTLKIHMDKVTVQSKYGSGGLWVDGVLPKHQLKDVPIKDMAASPEIRKHPVGIGAFRVTNVVDGESVEYEANEYYWRGKPKIDKVVLKRVPSSNIVAALQNGEYDLALSMPTDTFNSYKDLKNYTMLGRPQMGYTYVGFKLGKWDQEKAENVLDPNAKMADKSLRQAMAYAVDNDAVGEKFYQGLRKGANSLIVPVFKDYYNPDNKRYNNEPDQAKKLLDEAGYKDVDGDGFRENPKGEKLQINFASMAGGETAEPIAQYYLQCWKEIGLDVKLTDGRLLDFNNFYERLEKDDPSIDVYQGAWGVASDPVPDGTYGRTSPMNYTRWSSDASEDLIAKMSDDQAYADESKRVQAFKDWQALAADELPAFPTLFRTDILPVNKRVKNFNYDRFAKDYWENNLQNLELTQDAPVK